MSIIENPNITLAQLGIFKEKIMSNTADAQEYEQLDNFLVSLGLDKYILPKLQDFKIYSYEQYIQERKNDPQNKHKAEILGTILGVISALETILKK